MADPDGVETDPVWERLVGQISWYSARSRSAQRSYKLVKVLQIVVGAAVPVLVALQASAAVTAAMATVVVIAEGMQQVFQWHANWLNYRTTAEALKHEKFMYLAEARVYAAPNRRELLAERIEVITAKENVQWHSDNVESRNNSGAGPP